MKRFVQLSNVYYAGSHGMDIKAPPRPVKSSDGKYHTGSPGTKVSFFSSFPFLVSSSYNF